MVLKVEKLKEKEITTGKSYSNEIINFYCKEYDCVLIKLNEEEKSLNKNDQFIIKHIINNADMIINNDFSSSAAYKKKIVIIEKI